MRHRKKKRKLTKSVNQRRALLRNLSSSLILKEKIITTEAKAKEVRCYTEKHITRAKNDTLANRRLLLKNFSNEAVKKLFEDLGPRYKNHPGGYVRLTKINFRISDGAKMAIIELTK